MTTAIFALSESRQIGVQSSTETTPDFALRLLKRWPLLPVTHVLINGTPLVAYMQHVEGQTMHYAKAEGGSGASAAAQSKAPVKPTDKRTGKRKQGYSERYRQHWIDKDNAKRNR
jgi:hypothetical protein